jgi:flagellar hook protein FlgE
MLSGVGGLKAHQQMIDVAGNNLANVNTTSFKSSSVTFQELLSETLKEASAPTATLGGTNPMQIGSGVITGSVNRNMAQGSLIYTGNPMDMAIEGNGYFTLNDGLGDRYTRVGQFAVDSEYYLVDPTTGYRVQRIGNEGVAEGFQDATSNAIRIPYDIALPASATTEISFAGNLSGNKTEPTKNLLTSGLKYTIRSTGAVASRLTNMTDLTQSTNLTGGDTIRIQGTKKNGDTVDYTYTYTNTSDATQETISLDAGNAVTGVVTSDYITNTDATAGTLTIDFAGESVVLNLAAGQTMTMQDFIDAWNASAGESTASFDTDHVVLTKNVAGASNTGISFTDSTGGMIEWGDGTGVNVPAASDATATAGVAEVGGQTLGDLLDAITTAFRVDGNDASVAKIVNGEIRIEDAEAGYSQAYVSDMTFSDTDSSGSDITLPSQFDILVAGGQIEKPVNVEVFDNQGNSYTLAGSFVRTDNTNEWDFVVKSVGGDSIIYDRFVHQIGFQVDGSYGDMQGSDNNTIEIAFPSDPTNIRTITLDMGTLGELNGLTQFGGPSTAASNGQDGYAAGWLSTMSVSREGTLVGVFSNGIRRDIAALKVATFQNAAGLKSTGGNYYEPTANSGDPVPNKATEGGAGVVHGGAIEKSNVEVAEEFVKLIEAQNGYQANARTIKIANEMLQELTNLIR